MIFLTTSAAVLMLYSHLVVEGSADHNNHVGVI